MKDINFGESEDCTKEVINFLKEKKMFDFFHPIYSETKPTSEYKIVYKNYFSDVYSTVREKSFDDEIYSENSENALQQSINMFFVLSSISSKESSLFFIHIKNRFENYSLKKGLIYMDIYSKLR